jgi:hypothetical protein
MIIKKLLVAALLIGAAVNAHVLTDLQNEEISIEQTRYDKDLINRQIRSGGICGSIFGLMTGAFGSMIFDEYKRSNIAYGACRLAEGLKQQEVVLIIAAATIGGYCIGNYFAEKAWKNYKAKNVELQKMLLNSHYRSGIVLDLALRTASIQDFMLHTRVEYVDYQFPLCEARAELENIKSYFESSYNLLQDILTFHPESTNASVAKKLEEYQLRIEVTNRAVRQVLAELKATEEYRTELKDYRSDQERQAKIQQQQNLAQAQINAQNSTAHAAQAQAAAAKAQSDREWREYWFGKPATQVNVNHNYHN